MGETPVRSVRVPDGIWWPARARAAGEGRTVSDVIVVLLAAYGRGDGQEMR